jgi:hypothetical protein
MTIEWFGRDNRVVRIKSTNVHMSTTQIELLQSVYRTRKKLTRRGLAFLAATANRPGLPLDTAPTAPQ